MGKKDKKRAADSEEEEEDDEDYEGLEDEEDLEDEEEGGAKASKGGKKRRRGAQAFFDEAAEVDDEEEDEDGGGAKKTKKRNVFIDDIADVDDDEEEEEEDDEAEDLIDDHDVEIRDELARTAADHARFRALHRQEDGETAEEAARRYEERARQEGGYDFEDAAAFAQTGAVGQQAMLPTVNDPKLWILNCRPGHEREAVCQLLQKAYSMHAAGTPLLIKSAVALDHLKGYIYVEAEKEAHVRDAMRGLRTIFAGKGVKLVPLNEMVDAITVNRKAKETIMRDSWVRVRTGLYKDDLAKVVDVDSAAQKAIVRVVPRLDLQAMANRDEEARKKNPFGRTGPVRPAAKPFMIDEARQLALPVTRMPGPDGQVYLQLGTHRFVAGYEERNIALKSLTPVEGVPPLEELQRYNACGAAADEDRAPGGGAAGDLSSLVAALPSGGSAPRTTFVKGDLVRIVKGELLNLEALVESVREDGKVIVKPKLQGFDETVDFDADELRKVFKVGDRVRVVNGTYMGEVGMVLKVDDTDQCTVISDTTKQEVRVFGRDLTLSDGPSTGVETLGEFALHDLVQLDMSTAGVIIGIQRDAARVLTSASTPEQPVVKVVRSTDIQRKLKTKNIISTDQYNNQVRAGDMVNFLLGAGPGGRGGRTVSGTVEYVWRSMLFLKGREFVDAGGFVVVRSNKCTVRGANGPGSGGGPGADLARKVAASPTPLRTPMSPGHAAFGSSRTPLAFAPQSPGHYALASQAAAGGGAQGGGFGGFKPPPPRMGGGPGGGGGAGSFSGRTSHGMSAGGGLVGRSVRLVGGQYNGYKGRVKHETPSHVQLELDAISGRIVTVEKKFVRDEASVAQPGSAPGYGPPRGSQGPMGRGPSQGYGGAGGGSQDDRLGSSQYGTRTPLHPSQTPMHPSMTPAHYSSHMTPSHAPYTPMHAPTPGDDSYWGTSQQHGADRGQHAAPTPGGYGGGQGYTPSAYTPAALTPYDQGQAAPTPALDGPAGQPLTAATPGQAPTPGMPAHAPTPYLPATTPAVTPGAAPTPGLGMGYGYTPATGATPGAAATPGLGPAPTPGLGHAPTPGFGLTNTPGLGLASTPHMAFTPGLDTMGMGGPAAGGGDDFGHWEGVLVHLPGAGEPSSRPLGVVRGSTGDGRLRVVPGSYDAAGVFRTTPGALEDLADGSSLALAPPGKKDKVRIIRPNEDAAQHVGRVGTVAGLNVHGAGECFVRLEGGGEDICVLPISCLGKLAVQE